VLARRIEIPKAWPLAIPPALAAFLSWGPATQGPTTCPFAIITGQACPLCGGTRAASALLRGDLPLAWNLHPIIFVVAPLVLAGFARWMAVRSGRAQPLNARTVNQAVTVLGVLFVGVWIVRALSGTLPPI
jgi:Protein of unknown function (DUF2752)